MSIEKKLNESNIDSKPTVIPRKAPTQQIYSSTVDLASYLEDLKMSIPVFGYPLLHYSTKDIQTPVSPTPKWSLLAKPIVNKYASSIPIGEILEKYNRHEEMFTRVFT